MVNIQSPTTEIRRGKKRKKKKEERNSMIILWSALLHRATINIKTTWFTFNIYKATGYASEHIWCLYQAKIKWDGCSRKASGIKMDGTFGGGSLTSPDGVSPIHMVGVSASVTLPFTIKSRRFLLAPAHRIVPEKGP